MPISPDHGAALAQAAADLAANVELEVLRLVRRYLAQGIDAPTWATDKLAELQRVRAGLTAELATLDARLAAVVTTTLAEAYAEGAAVARADLVAGGVTKPIPQARAAALRALSEDLVARLDGTGARVLREAADVYQRVVADASATVILGGTTRRAAAQAALDRLVGAGIGGFTDRAGRNWRLESYVEMATRTSSAQASLAGHMDTLTAAGENLVHIIPGPRACPVCDQWAGQILTINGAATPPAVATLAEARAAGWGHPNCRCVTGIYLPGFTQTTTQRPDPRGYEAQQQQRALERRIRAAKRRAAVSLDPQREREATTQVRQAQAALRTHLAAHPQLKRQSAREQIGKAT